MVLCSGLKYSATEIISSIFNVTVWKELENFFEAIEPCFKRMLSRRQTEVGGCFLKCFIFIFSECTLPLNDEKLSTINANFAHKNFIDTEFAYGNDAKKIWLAFQGYDYEENPSAIHGNGRKTEDFAERKAPVAASNELKQFVKLFATSCDKHILSV